MAIIQRKNGGNYRVSIYLGRDEKTGRKLYRWETVKGSKEARDRETELKNEKRLGIFIRPGNLKLAEFLERWLRDYAKPNLAASTYRGYKQQVENHVKPVLGHLLLTSLNPARMSEYYSDRMSGGLSAMTVTHHRTMLHKAFKTAIEWGLLIKNPVDGSTGLKITKKEMDTYSPEEVLKYLNAAKRTPYYALLHLVLYTGLSRSEILGLKWKDVTLDVLNPSVSVNRSLHEKAGGGWYLKSPKTASRKRLVVLSPASAVVLQDHYTYCKSICDKLDTKINDDMFIFCNLANGEPYRPGYITRMWSRIANIANLKHIRLHDARHTHATILIKQGVPMKVVQERLGHKDYSTTANIYSHVTPSMQQSAAKSFDEALKPEYNKSGNPD